MLRTALLAGATLTTSVPAPAQQYPGKAVRVIVPFPAGSRTDIQARVLAREMQEQMGQSFIVDNRPGARGALGSEVVASAAPDGHMMLFTSGALAIAASLASARTNFDPVQALAPISRVTSAPLVLVTHPGVPARSAEDLIEVSRRRPTVLNAAINLTGSASHLSAVLLKQLAGLKFTTVAYKGAGLSMVAVLRGEVDFYFAEVGLAARQMKAAKVRGLAVTTAEPSDFFPGLPTMNSLLPGFVIDEWFAMYFPAGTRPEIVAIVNGALQNALESKIVRAFFAEELLSAVGSTPEDLEAYLKREIARYREIVRKGRVMLE